MSPEAPRQVFATLEEDARRVYDVLRSGGVALIPTNVSYGLVAMDDNAVRRIYELKGRPSSKPCVTVSNHEIYDDVALPLDAQLRSWLDDIVTQTPLAVISRLNPNSRLLATLSPYVFSQVTQEGTIATFFSAGELVQRVGELALADGRLVVGSSGNVSGAGNNSTFEAVPESIRSGVDLAIDWGPVRYANDQRLSTTILNLLTGTFLRQGVNYAQIEEAWLSHTNMLQTGSFRLPLPDHFNGGLMFAVIRHYHFDKKDSAEIDRLIQEQFVPLIRKGKGFVRYYWLDTGNGEGASFGVFKDKAGADESVELAREFVHDHMAKLLRQKPEVIEGPIKAHD